MPRSIFILLVISLEYRNTKDSYNYLSHSESSPSLQPRLDYHYQESFNPTYLHHEVKGQDYQSGGPPGYPPPKLPPPVPPRRRPTRPPIPPRGSRPEGPPLPPRPTRPGPPIPPRGVRPVPPPVPPRGIRPVPPPIPPRGVRPVPPPVPPRSVRPAPPPVPPRGQRNPPPVVPRGKKPRRNRVLFNHEPENTLDANDNVFDQEYSFEGINNPLQQVPLNPAWHESVYLSEPLGEIQFENSIRDPFDKYGDGCPSDKPSCSEEGFCYDPKLPCKGPGLWCGKGQRACCCGSIKGNPPQSPCKGDRGDICSPDGQCVKATRCNNNNTSDSSPSYEFDQHDYLLSPVVAG